MRRGLIALLLGALLGGALGLYLGWVVFPVELVDVGPSVLEPTTQDDYLRLVAATYAQDGDFEAARRRLGALGRADVFDWVRTETVDAILQAENEQEIRQLVNLAHSLGLTSPAMAPYLPADTPTPPTR